MGTVDEGTTAITMPQIAARPIGGKKKKKKKIAAHYLAPTAASKAMKRDKSPNANAKTVVRSAKSPSNPSTSPSQQNSKTVKRLGTSPQMTSSTSNRAQSEKDDKESTAHWIEDLPIEQLKLYFNQYRTAYKEFVVLSEMTTIILQDMGIFLKTFTRTERRKSDRILELEEEGELEMTDGIY